MTYSKFWGYDSDSDSDSDFADIYLAYEYSPNHPYFIYMVNKYEPIAAQMQIEVGILYDMIDNMNESTIECELLIKKRNELEHALMQMNIENIWSDDEEEACYIKNYVHKRTIQFPQINLEELCQEAFKPSRVMYQYLIDPDYYD